MAGLTGEARSYEAWQRFNRSNATGVSGPRCRFLDLGSSWLEGFEERKQALDAWSKRLTIIVSALKAVANESKG